MKKLLLIITTITLLSGCADEPILKESEYQIVDTLEVSKNNWGIILGHRVIIRFNHDSTLHYGFIHEELGLIKLEIKPIDLKKYNGK
jgi:hypothetical protein